MSTFLNQNQFAQTPVLGQLSMTPTPSTFPVRIDPASTATKLQAGQGFKLVSTTSNDIMVDQCSAVTDEAFGVSVYNPKINIYLPGQVIEIALKDSVVFMEASAAISRGAKVQLTPAGPTVQTLTSLATNCMIGIALDNATGAGQLIRILINPRDPNLSAY